MDPLTRLVEAIDDFSPKIWHREFEIKRNDFLVRSGETDRYAYFIQDGAVRIFIQEKEEDLTIRFGYKGSFIAVLPSFLKGAKSEMNVQAMRKSRIKSIHKDSLYRFLDTKPELALLWRELLESLVIQQIEREIDILTASPADRYQRVLDRSPELFQEVSQKYIASYLRMSPETLSRLNKSYGF